MGGGNGAKAAHKREINAKDAKKAGSQLKTNAAAQSIQCDICKSTFQSTSKEAQLKLHSDNKHPKQTFKDCFPNFTGA